MWNSDQQKCFLSFCSISFIQSTNDINKSEQWLVESWAHIYRLKLKLIVKKQVLFYIFLFSEVTHGIFCIVTLFLWPLTQVGSLKFKIVKYYIIRTNLKSIVSAKSVDKQRKFFKRCVCCQLSVRKLTQSSIIFDMNSRLSSVIQRKKYSTERRWRWQRSQMRGKWSMNSKWFATNSYTKHQETIFVCLILFVCVFSTFKSLLLTVEFNLNLHTYLTHMHWWCECAKRSNHTFFRREIEITTTTRAGYTLFLDLCWWIFTFHFWTTSNWFHNFNGFFGICERVQIIYKEENSLYWCEQIFFVFVKNAVAKKVLKWTVLYQIATKNLFENIIITIQWHCFLSDCTSFWMIWITKAIREKWVGVPSFG